MVGTRSAVFAPMVDLGLIIVDEEHDSSYKQEETPRYHGRDVAVMRAKLQRHAWWCWGRPRRRLRAGRTRRRAATRGSRCGSGWRSAPLPTVELVDMREEFRETGQEQIFSRRLIEETQATLDRGEQVVILLNRRGYSFVVMCRSCGEKIECENCAISMTFHKPAPRRKSILMARAGRAAAGVPLLRLSAVGAEDLPEVLRASICTTWARGRSRARSGCRSCFRHARIGRMDRDTVRGRGDMERLLARLHAGEINLLVGTQMIAKGHDIHGVTLVGVVGADSALGLPDFRAAERVFQLLTQVSGGRGGGSCRARCWCRRIIRITTRSSLRRSTITRDSCRRSCSIGAGCTIRRMLCWRT